MSTVVAAFATECEALEGVLRRSPEPDFVLPTNCPPWDLKELVAHIEWSIRFPVFGFRPAETDAPRIDAAGYYRRAERSTKEYRTRNVETTQQAAAVYPDGPAAVEAFAQTWRASVATAGSEDLSMEVATPWGAACTIEDFVRTRIIAVAAHGVDVAITLGRPGFTTRAALDVVRPVFVSLLGAEPPSDWDDQTFLEIATGRRPLGETDADALGPLAARFPLLS
jgi:uncharacterized protein (TIGR03083 family)